jgi:hypothetical protein
MFVFVEDAQGVNKRPSAMLERLETRMVGGIRLQPNHLLALNSTHTGEQDRCWNLKETGSTIIARESDKEN